MDTPLGARINSLQDEKFSDTKKRLEKRTGLTGKNFEKIKFAVVRRSAYSKPTYLADGKLMPNTTLTYQLMMLDDILWEVAQDDDSLGLDHVDRTRAMRNGTQDLFLK